MEGNIKDFLLTNPIYLNKSEEVDEVSNFYLPYSTGFEVECDKANNFNEDEFKNIPNIMEVRTGSEQRFRIPPGLEGFKCLFHISQALCDNCIPTDSGIHYHIDFTDCFEQITDKVIEKIKPFILKELDTWNYKGTYNSRDVRRSRCWVRVHSTYKTLEFRIGEMTFDYELMVKRIIHCNYISKVIKNNLSIYEEAIELESEVEESDRIILEQERMASQYSDNIRDVIKNRTKRARN